MRTNINQWDARAFAYQVAEFMAILIKNQKK